MKPLASACGTFCAGSFLTYLICVALFSEANYFNWPAIGRWLWWGSVAAFGIFSIIEFVLLKKKAALILRERRPLRCRAGLHRWLYVGETKAPTWHPVYNKVMLYKYLCTKCHKHKTVSSPLRSAK